MDTYSLLWNGALVSVTVPPVEELESEQGRWTWVAVRMTGGSIEAAWHAALALECPGLGWSSTVTETAPTSYDACVFGAAPMTVTDVGMSSFGAKPLSRTPTHRGPPPYRAQSGKHGVSGNAGPHKRPTQQPTSSASSHPAPVAEEARRSHVPPIARQSAKPGKGGWMGRAATKPPGPSVAPRA